MDNSPLPSFPGPQLAGPVHVHAPFSLGGRMAWLGGTEAHGVQEIRISGLDALRRLRIRDSGPAYAARATPGGFERRLHVEGREVLERALVAGALPGAILEWSLLPGMSASGPCLDPLDLDLEWLAPLRRATEAAAPAVEASASRVTVTGAGGCAAFVFSRAASPAATGGAGTGAEPLFRAGVRLLPGESVRMTIAAARDRDALEQALLALGDAPGLLASAAADAQRRAGQALVLGAPDPAAGMALRWALARLPHFLTQPLPGGTGAAGPGATASGDVSGLAVTAGYATGVPARESAGAALRVGLALLAGGDTASGLEVARRALEISARMDAAAPAALLLYAEYVLATGDGGAARAAWPQLLRAAERAAAASAGAELTSAALSRLALAAESAGLQADAAALRAGAHRLAREDGAARALAEAGGWAHWAAGDTRVAYRAWRAHAETGLFEGRAVWGGPAAPDDALATAAVVTGIAHGMLGLEPDAPRARLRLRPQFPAEWELAELTGIRLGDAEVVLRYRAAKGRARYEVEQIGGGVPLRMILEAAVTRPVTAATVDGQPAVLAPHRWGECTVVPVQLVLDARRVLELELGGGEAA